MAKFCSHCGAELSEGSQFCGKCGAQIGVETVHATYVNGQQPKSKIVAGLLGIFLGGWGIHNFYLGYTNKGVTQIILTVVTCGIAALWGFIEGILILCGNIDKDADGDRKSVV